MQMDNVAEGRPVKPTLFYGWVIAFAAALGTACSISVFLPSTISLLVGPLAHEFHWSPKAIFASIAVVAGATILVAPIIGGVIDRFGVVPVLVFSFLAEAALIASFKYLTGDIYLFYARYAALSILATGTTSIAYSTVLSRWFDKYRGLALGISLAGVGLGGFVWSLVAQYLFDRVGWRDAFPIMAGMIAITMIPLMLLTMRDYPAAMGLHVDGRGDARDAPSPQAGLSVAQIFASAQFWLMAVSFFILAVVLYGVMLNLVPMLKMQGESVQAAAKVQAVQWIVIIVGRIATGFLIDRFFAPRVAIALLIMPLAGIAMFAVGVTGVNVFLAAMLVGVAVGAEGDMLSYMTGRYFGLKHYGMIYAVFYGLYGVGTGFGPTIIAAAVEHFKSYAPVLCGLCGLLVLTAVLLMMFRRFPKSFSEA